MKISNREIIIAAIAILVLLGIGYLINNNSNKDNSKEETSQEDQVNLDDNKGSDDENKEKSSLPDGIASVEPAEDAKLTVATAPGSVVVKSSEKQFDAGSEIQVVSDKGVDIVTAGNRLSSDLKTLTAPVRITVPGTYNVTYKINFQDGTKTEGSYSFTISQ